MVLIPGNHDICWNTSRLAMEQVPDAECPSNLYEALIKPDSVYRWSWSEQTLFRIADMAVYEQRLDYYWDFAESFYEDVNLPVPINRGRGFQFLNFVTDALSFLRLTLLPATTALAIPVRFLGVLLGDAQWLCGISVAPTI